MAKKKDIEEDEDDDFDEDEDEEEEKLKEKKKPSRKVEEESPEGEGKMDELTWQYYRQPEMIGIFNKKTKQVITDQWEALRRILSLQEEILEKI